MSATLLLDIEGTTTSISFVYDVLFPFARRQLDAFVRATWDTDETRAVVHALREIEPTLAPIPAGDGAAAMQAASAELLAQMDIDRKSTPLKALQGRIWRAGYESGEIKGHVYDDVPGALRRWHEAAHRAAIYSSGSVEAQVLLFRHSVAGDLTPLLSGHFDTTTGPKRESASYRDIAGALGASPASITFWTDNLDEALAAHAAGLRAVIASRPGNAVLPLHDFPVCTSLAEVAELAAGDA
ncbi:MAG: acireductone synthase [Myxococcales bacterium]|nr:acireductone synthase [Myxococcales bacterium]MCB9521111.1 acireductone synthase [Myxococcales bacterium]MCB9531859.1 acireductone synthase [Myxococcales bacterium]